RGLGVLGDVLGDGEGAPRAGALRVHPPLGDDLAVEVGELLQEPDVLEQHRPARAGGDGVVVVPDGRAGGGREGQVLVAVVLGGHSSAPCVGKSGFRACSRQGGVRAPTSLGGGATGGAGAPEEDLGGVDGEAVVLTGGETGGMPDDARHVTDRAAAATHDVVVVVAAEELEPAGGAVGLDATQDPGVGQRVEDVVHGLRGDGADPVVDRGTDL